MALRIRPGLGLELRAHCRARVHPFDSPGLARLGYNNNNNKNSHRPRYHNLVHLHHLLPYSRIAGSPGFATLSRLTAPGSRDSDDQGGVQHPEETTISGGVNSPQAPLLPDESHDDGVATHHHAETVSQRVSSLEHQPLPLQPALPIPQTDSAERHPGEHPPNPASPSEPAAVAGHAAAASATPRATKLAGITGLKSASGQTLSLPDAVHRRLPLPGSNQGVCVKPFEVFPHWRETLRSFRSHFGSWKLQRMLNYRRQEVLGRYVRDDWHHVLNMLVQSTPQRAPGGVWVKFANRIDLPPAAARTLLESADGNIWDIYDLTDCEIDAYLPDDPEALVPMLLSGDETSVNEAWDMMRATCEQHGQPINHLHLELYRRWEYPSSVAESSHCQPNPLMPMLKDEKDGVGVPVRAIPDIVDHDGPLYSERIPPDVVGLRRVSSKHSGSLFAEERPLFITRFNQIPKPTQWTKLSFCRYLNALSRAQISPARLQIVYGTAARLLASIRVLVEKAFAYAASEGALSATSFRIGLKLLTRYGLAREHLDAFFVNMAYGYQMTEAVADARVWNLMLEPIVRTHNLEQFTGVVENMMAYRVRPNRRTWQLFIQLVEHPMAKRAIMLAMHRKGLTGEYKTMRIVGNELAMENALEACRAGLSLDSFIYMQTTRLGRAWLSQHSLSHTVEAFCRYGRFDETLALLDYAYDPRNHQPVSPVAINWHIIAYHARVQDNPRVLADAIASTERINPAYITAVFYDEALRLAWDARRPALMAEAWLAACVRNKLTRTSGARIANIFSWLIGRLAADPAALPWTPGFMPGSAATAQVWGPVLIPSLFSLVARHVWETHPPTTHTSISKAWWRDKTRVLEKCIATTRTLFNAKTTPLGPVLQEAVRDEDLLLAQWHADRTPATAAALGITPLGAFIGNAVQDTIVPEDAELLELADHDKDTSPWNDGAPRSGDTELELMFRQKFDQNAHR